MYFVRHLTDGSDYSITGMVLPVVIIEISFSHHTDNLIGRLRPCMAKHDFGKFPSTLASPYGN